MAAAGLLLYLEKQFQLKLFGGRVVGCGREYLEGDTGQCLVVSNF